MIGAGNATDDSDRGAGGPPAGTPARVWPKWIIVVCMAGHVWATCRALPLSAVRDHPVLAYNDFAVHAHRAHVFREAFRASGDTWGCDPAVCGGVAVLPPQDVGSALYETIALFLPQVETGRLVTAITWCAVLIAPLLLLGAARLLALDAEQMAWALLVATGFLWLEPTHVLMLHVGMVAFLLSSFMCLLVLAACDRLLRGPTTAGCLGIVAAASLLFLTHPYGPVAIVPGLLWLVAKTPDVTWRWRLALLAVALPVAALNAFWLVPVLAGLHVPLPPWRTTLGLSLPYWNWSSWRDLAHCLVPELLLAAVLATSGFGLAMLARRQRPVTIGALGVTLLFTWLLQLFGSFWSATRILQPVRFIIVFLDLSALLWGCAIVALYRRLGLPWFLRVAAYVITGLIFILAIQFFGESLVPPQDEVDLVAFIRLRTEDGDRVLLEAAPPYPWLGLALPAITHREVISSAFPDLLDPIQFSTEGLFGSSAENASIDHAKEVLARFNVNWVIVRNGPWREFFRMLTAGNGEAIGPYEAFALTADHSRFLVGTGEVRADINRMELRNVSSSEDYVVIRYRYHPGWVCDAPSTIEPFPTPDNSGGLLLIRHPSPTTLLRFDPSQALRTPWPAAQRQKGTKRS